MSQICCTYFLQYSPEWTDFGASVPPVSLVDVTDIIILAKYLSMTGSPKRYKNIPKSQICTMSLKITEIAPFVSILQGMVSPGMVGIDMA